LRPAGAIVDVGSAVAVPGCTGGPVADSSDPTDLRTALATLDALEAEPLAHRVRVRLRELGVTRIPRGPVRPGATIRPG